jgi:hypothetical protein
LQRRLASSPAAIYRSLRRRRERLKARLAEERIIARGGRLQQQEQLPSLFDDEEDRDLDEAGGAELEEAEQQIADRATAAQTIPELEGIVSGRISATCAIGLGPRRDNDIAFAAAIGNDGRADQGTGICHPEACNQNSAAAHERFWQRVRPNELMLKTISGTWGRPSLAA